MAGEVKLLAVLVLVTRVREEALAVEGERHPLAVAVALYGVLLHPTEEDRYVSQTFECSVSFFYMRR